MGNEHRGDDGIGRAVVRLMQLRIRCDVRLLEYDGEATALLAEFQSARSVWLVDAAQSGARPGTIHRIDCAVSDAAVLRGTISSHGFGVAEAIGLARALGTLPPQCIVYAIEAADFTLGAPLSPAVAHAAHEVAERVLAEVINVIPAQAGT